MTTEKFTDQLMKYWPMIALIVTSISSVTYMSISWALEAKDSLVVTQTALKEKEASIKSNKNWLLNLQGTVNELPDKFEEKLILAKGEISQQLEKVEEVRSDVNDLNVKTEVLGEQLEAVKQSQKRTEEDVKETREEVQETNDLIRELIQQQQKVAPQPMMPPQPYPQQYMPQQQYVPPAQFYYPRDRYY